MHLTKGNRDVILREDFTQLIAGNIIGYYLRSIDLPKNPYQIWRGRVIDVDTVKNTVTVVLLDKGFEGAIEAVEWEQIAMIEVRVTERR
jgi:hypothetical protein